MSKTKKQIVSGFHRPVCKMCHCELRPETNEVGLLDMYNPSDKPDPQPYQIWDADLWKCPKCGVEIVGGFAYNPIDEHWRDTFETTLKLYEQQGLLIENNG